MTAAAIAPAQPHPRVSRRVALDWGAVWLLGFAPTVYLALSGGGYDIIARSEIGILLWWIVLLGAIVGVLPRTRLSRAAWVAVALLAAFFAWTWIATSWSQSQELTLAEAARVATYLGVLVLGVSLTTRATLRPLLYGLASAIAVVSLIAVLSRLIPSWFPANQAANAFYLTPRLAYPFDYSDGVGEFMALGLPLLLFVATGARSLWGRALGAAGIPIVILGLVMTLSRGGILAAVVGVVLFFALVPDRLPRLATALVGAGGGVILSAALIRRPGVRDVLMGQAPADQRHTMLVLIVLVAVAVGLIQFGISLALRTWRRPSWSVFSPRAASVVGALIAGAVLVAIAVVFATGAAHHLWTDFKRPNAPAGKGYLRLLSVSGSHRYQYWTAAIDASKPSPWKGIGPGTFRFYWAQHNTLHESVQNAHSLYLETLAETGIIGLALIGGFFLLVLGAGSARAMRSADGSRVAIATAVAGIGGFCAAAAFDWVWQIGVIPLIAMLLAAGALSEPAAPEVPPDAQAGARTGVRARRATRIILAVGALPALWAIIVPLSSTIAVRSSQAAARSGQFRPALSDAATGQRIQPGAASPWLQRALILEQLGDIRGASQAILEAAKREPTNWQIWVAASRIATEANQPRLALAYYRRARSLNPTSPIFNR